MSFLLSSNSPLLPLVPLLVIAPARSVQCKRCWCALPGSKTALSFRSCDQHLRAAEMPEGICCTVGTQTVGNAAALLSLRGLYPFVEDALLKALMTFLTHHHSLGCL